MIGLDTNVLVRYFVEDDPQQAQAAERLLENLSEAEPGWIGQIVLVELAWTLRYTYRLQRTGIAEIVEKLLASPGFLIEQNETVRSALALYRACNADLADCIIAISARAAGCTRTVTFDRVAARDAGMELLG